MKTAENKEIWKDIPGYEGLYQASNMGRVRSLDANIPTHNGKNYCTMFRKGRILRQQERTGGYLYVVLSKNGEAKPKRVHRLVAIAFIPNPNNLPQINHKDTIRTNNSADNLEWCDNRYNFEYSNVRLSRAKAVDQLAEDGTCIQTFYSIREASRRTGIGSMGIGLCCRGKRGTSGGYKWRYANGENE